MTTKSRVLVLSPSPVPSFARQDGELLSSSFEVDVEGVRGLGSISQLDKSIGRADALLIWFLGRSAVLPMILARMRRVPVVAVIGGFEVAWVKALKYGIRPKSLKEGLLRRMIVWSDVIISVSHFSREQARKRFQKYETKFVIIPNAVDTNRFNLGSQAYRSGVISVGVINRTTIELKSIRMYVETARRMPDVQFTLIGSAADQAAQDFIRGLPANLQWLGEIRHDDLPQRLQAASVCFQASVYESFCVALAEGMSCGCFPVISNCAALPEVAGPTATIMKDLTLDSAEDAIRTALNKPESERETPRRRIVEHYGIESRRKLLCSTIQSVIDQSKR